MNWLRNGVASATVAWGCYWLGTLLWKVIHEVTLLTERGDVQAEETNQSLCVKKRCMMNIHKAPRGTVAS